MSVLTVNLFSIGNTPGGQQRELPIPDSLSVLEDHQELEKGQHLFRIINQKDGDKRVVWNAMSMQEIQEAKEMFDKLVEEGMIPYNVDVKGKKTPEVMSEFDASAEEIIFAPIPALVGG